jgi:hypothetical protein
MTQSIDPLALAVLVIGTAALIALPVMAWRWWRRYGARRRWSPTARNAVQSHMHGATFGAPRFRR